MVVGLARTDYMRSEGRCWAHKSFEERKQELSPLLENYGNWIERFVEAVVADACMPRTEATESLAKLHSRISWFFEQEESSLSTVQDYGGIVNELRRVPYGVCGLITPWNHPITIVLWNLIPSLLAGNVVVLKPSEKCPAVNQSIREYFEMLPKGVVSVVEGGPDVVEALVRGGSLDHVTFIGSSDAAKKVYALAAEAFIPVIIESGGKDALIVDRTADIPSAVAAAIVGSLRSCGQLCSSIERIYVHEDIADQFNELLERELRCVVVGPIDSAYVTKLKDPHRIARIEDQITEACRGGAKVIHNQLNEDGFAALLNVPSQSLLFTKETFGPVVSVSTYSRHECLIEELNESEFGLCCTVWTKDEILFEKFASSLDVGTISLNRLAGTLSRSPWGGRKMSGIGFSLGPNPFEPFTTIKNVRRSEPKAHKPYRTAM